MKKYTVILLALALMATLFAGCGCKHEWIAANCENAQVCKLCGEVDGAPLGHKWEEADCESPKRCESCNITEGEALGHKWEEASSEAPKTCTVCQKTEGERIITDSRFHTAACKPLFGTWQGEMIIDGEKQFGMYVPGEDLNIKANVTLTYNNDGTMRTITRVDPESYLRVLRLYTIEMTYVSLELQGISRIEADAAMRATYGTDVPGYVDMQLKDVDISSANSDMNFVYYVEGDTVYDAASWDDEMSSSQFRVEGNKLTMIDEATDIQIELTKQK